MKAFKFEKYAMFMLIFALMPACVSNDTYQADQHAMWSAIKGNSEKGDRAVASSGYAEGFARGMDDRLKSVEVASAANAEQGAARDKAIAANRDAVLGVDDKVQSTQKDLDAAKQRLAAAEAKNAEQDAKNAEQDQKHAATLDAMKRLAALAGRADQRSSENAGRMDIARAELESLKDFRDESRRRHAESEKRQSETERALHEQKLDQVKDALANELAHLKALRVLILRWKHRWEAEAKDLKPELKVQYDECMKSLEDEFKAAEKRAKELDELRQKLDPTP